jgi:Na+-transporting methylmalonyl-CoA/oxaloacetate decarboxylase gamma subunit
MNNIGQGFAIMIMGLGITFTALGLFIGLILLLERIFPPKSEVEEEGEVEVRPLVSQMERDTSEEEIAAAIAIALAHLYSYELCRSDLGIDLESGHGPWWIGGRLGQVPLGSLSLRGRN